MSTSIDPLESKVLLGRYRVMRLLGEGGMGTVHLARVEGAEGFTRPVVVKRMRRDIRSTEEGNRLFIREAKILSRMQHPGIVGISDFGVEDGHHIMVLEYVHGYTLSPWLEYRRALKVPLPVDLCIYVVRRILDALHYAHHFDTEEGQEIQIVHRDVAPDNVLLSNKGYVHLLDFGVASITGPQAGASTQSGVFRGKLCYAAPETVHGKPATPRSDQYSAAILLLELLTGETPFMSDSMGETFLRMVNEAPPAASSKRDDIPAGLDDVLAKSLAKLPEDRFESALAFSRELRRFQQDDDDEVAERLKNIVREDFEQLPETVGVEALKSREQALARILTLAPGPATENAKTVPAMELSRATAEGAVASAVAAAPAATAGRQVQGLLWGLLGVGALIALGLGAAVALISRGAGSEGQVVVVGGDREPATAVSPESPSAAPASAEASSSPSSSPVADPEGNEPTAAPSNPVAPVGVAVAQKETPKTRQQKLSEAVQKQSGAYQACFSRHLNDTEKTPKAVLHFSVASAGGAAQVNIEPPSVATTPLGLCLKDAAARVRFPPLEQPVAFRVPVSARVSRVKGKL